jgi:hypothetical protein
MTGPTMTPSDMNPTPEHAGQPDLDATSVEAVLTGAQRSGDPALDAALDALRALVSEAPEPSGELAQLLGPLAAPKSSGDELERRRQGSARHVATGTTVVAGIFLATATAAAAIGTLGADEHAGRSTRPPAVVSPPSATTPRPVRTAPTDLPLLPAGSPVQGHEASDPSSTTSHHGMVHSGPVSTIPRHGDDVEDSTEPDEPGEADDDAQTGDHEPSSTDDSSETADEDESSSSTSTGDHDDDGGRDSNTDSGSGAETAAWDGAWR